MCKQLNQPLSLETLNALQFACQMVLNKSYTVLDHPLSSLSQQQQPKEHQIDQNHHLYVSSNGSSEGLVVKHMGLELAWILANVCAGPDDQHSNQLLFAASELSYGQSVEPSPALRFVLTAL